MIFIESAYAAYDTSKVIEGWNFSNNTTGANSLYNLSWTGSSSYSNTIYYSSPAAAGDFSAGGYMISPSISQACYGFDIRVYITTGHSTAETDEILSDNQWFNWQLQIYNNGFRVYSYDHWIDGPTPTSVSTNAWHRIQLSVGTSSAILYVDGISIGSDALGYGSGTVNMTWTVMSSTATSGVYVDDFLMLATPGTGAPINPIVVGTFTFTPTVTPTFTVTPTPLYSNNEYIVLPFENNTVNIGTGSNTFTFTGTPVYSNTVVKDSLYSAGLFNQDNQYISNSQAITIPASTMQVYFFLPRLGMPIMGELWQDSNSKSSLYTYYGEVYYQDATAGTFGPYPLLQNVWHTIVMNFFGGKFYLYIDGALQVSHTGYQPGTDGTDTVYIGSDDSGIFPCFGYLDDFIMSTTNSSGSSIIPPGSTSTPTIQATQTYQALLTATKQAQLSFTPTPAASIAVCSNPFPDVFVQQLTPVLIPVATYEAGCVVEPNVIFCNADNLYHMTYSANAFALNTQEESICIATASNIRGPWTRYAGNPVIGNGGLGILDRCAMSYQLHIGSEYRIYFRNEDNDNVDYATSTDGLHYNYVGTALDRCQLPVNLCPYCAPIDGMGIIPAGGSTYYATAEIQSNTGECPGKVAYFLWLFKSNDNAQTFQSVSSDELLSLSPNPGGTLYAGGRSTVAVNTHWHTWTHIGYPTSIYHGVTYDHYNWYTEPVPVVTPWVTMFGLTACNQAADTSVIEVSGKTYLFFDGTDNTTPAGRIGYAVYNGTLAQYDACMNPLPTPTPYEKIYFNGEVIFSKTPEIIFNNSNRIF